MEDTTHVAYGPTSMTKIQDAAGNDNYHLYQTISLLELKIKIIGDFILQKFGFDIEQPLKMNLNSTQNYDNAAATGLFSNKQDSFNECVSQNDLVDYFNPLSSKHVNNSTTTTTNTTTDLYPVIPPSSSSSSPPNFTNFYLTPAINNRNVGVVEAYNFNNQSNKVINTGYNLTSNLNSTGKIKTIVTFNNNKMNAGGSGQNIKKRKLDVVESNCLNPLPNYTLAENQEEGNKDEEMMHSVDKNHENNFKDSDTDITMECSLLHQEISVQDNSEFTTIDVPIKMEVEMVEENISTGNGNNDNNNIHISSSGNVNEEDELSETVSTTTTIAESISQNSINQVDEFLSPKETHADHHEQNYGEKQNETEYSSSPQTQCDSDPSSYTNPFAKFVTTKDGKLVQIIHESDPDIDIKYMDPFSAFQFTSNDENEQDDIINDNDDNDDDFNTEENREQNFTENHNQQKLVNKNVEKEEGNSNHCHDEELEMDPDCNAVKDEVNSPATQQEQETSGDEQIQVEREVVNQEFEVDEEILEVEEAAPELDLEELQTPKSFKQPIEKQNQEQQEVLLRQFIQQERSNSNRRRASLPKKTPRENVPIRRPLPPTLNMTSFEKLVNRLLKSHAAFQTVFDFLWILNIKAYQSDKLPFLPLIKRDDIRAWFEYVPNKRNLASSTYRCRICCKYNQDPIMWKSPIETEEGLLKDTLLENRSCINYHSKQKSHKKIIEELVANSDPDALVIELEPNLKKDLLDALKESVEPATRLRMP